ncbi:hypothetical protein [uncultured Brevundimonas sp.]|uniref:hypothetical protein n=1 Tax=uncultured Brevundimonas sp. TaxID=213418 RepID=UPI0030ED53C5|tara:strand:- start:657 stop:848 length:192 start_codon:yes stop_codon:yes gene_type:complete
MAVISSAFGSVTLTEEDAQKFRRQVTYGRPKARAKESLVRGVAMATSFRENGRELTFKVEKTR